MYNYYTMEFEYDSAKSASNKLKHSIDFAQAKKLWDDPDLLEISARVTGEPRFVVIGKIKNQCWSAVITYRKEKIRIISVRRSREEEVMLYES